MFYIVVYDIIILTCAINIVIVTVSASKKLPCNHIFHTSCLRSWFQRQQTCPTCRLNILRTPGTPPTNNQGAPAQPAPVHVDPRLRPPFAFPWAPPPPPTQHPGQPGKLLLNQWVK